MFELIEGIVYIHTYIQICTWKHKSSTVLLRIASNTLPECMVGSAFIANITSTKLKSAKLN
jgi:hypothetical protein